MNEYCLDKSRYSRWLLYNDDIFCFKCGEDLRVGDFVVSISNGSFKKLYHKECWDSLFVDC